jgi:hypothetical protein
VYGPPYQDAPIVRDRPVIEARLLATEGQDLVLVHYTPSHNTHDEWVYNGADLQTAPVVWARDLGTAENGPLLDYYAGRNVWRLYADEEPPRLELLAAR